MKPHPSILPSFPPSILPSFLSSSFYFLEAGKVVTVFWALSLKREGPRSRFHFPVKVSSSHPLVSSVPQREKSRLLVSSVPQRDAVHAAVDGLWWDLWKRP